MSFTLDNPALERALTQAATELALIKDKNGAVLFATTGRGTPTKASFTSNNLPAAFVVLLKEKAQTEEIEEVIVEEVLIGILIIADNTPVSKSQPGLQADLENMEFLSESLTQLQAAARQGTPRGMENSTLNNLSPFGIHWIGSQTPLVNQYMPFNSIMP